MTPDADVLMPDLDLEPGTHICAFYAGSEQRDNILLPYLVHGLMSGHKCFAAIHEHDSGPFRAKIDRHAPDARAGQLVVRTADEHVLQTDDFTVERIIDFWDALVSSAADNYPFVRLTAEATWWLTQIPSTDDLLLYENELNNFAPRYPQSILCMYDIATLGDGIVLDLLKVHPKVILCRVPLENPYFMPPQEVLAARGLL